MRRVSFVVCLIDARLEATLLERLSGMQPHHFKLIRRREFALAGATPRVDLYRRLDSTRVPELDSIFNSLAVDDKGNDLFKVVREEFLFSKRELDQAELLHVRVNRVVVGGDSREWSSFTTIDPSNPRSDRAPPWSWQQAPLLQPYRALPQVTTEIRQLPDATTIVHNDVVSAVPALRSQNATLDAIVNLEDGHASGWHQLGCRRLLPPSTAGTRGIEDEPVYFRHVKHHFSSTDALELELQRPAVIEQFGGIPDVAFTAEMFCNGRCSMIQEHRSFLCLYLSCLRSHGDNSRLLACLACFSNRCYGRSERAKPGVVVGAQRRPRTRDSEL